MITIDTREKKPKRERASRFFSGLGIKSEQVKLDHGDYLIHGRILIERKGASDFVSSFPTLSGGRHSSFLTHCAEYGFMPVILLEGRPVYRNGHATYSAWETRNGKKRKVQKWTRVTKKQMDNFLLSAIRHGTHLMHTSDYNDSLSLMAHWAQYDLIAPHPLKFSPKLTNSERLQSFWSMYPGVGRTTAEKLAKYTFAELTRMYPETRIKRFGKKVALNIEPTIGEYKVRTR